MRDRDRDAASALRSAIAAIDNAEAVATDGAPGSTTSRHIAGAAVGVGAAEAPRRELSAPEEAAIVRAELADLREAARHRMRAGDRVGADRIDAAAGVLQGVLDAVS